MDVKIPTKGKFFKILAQVSQGDINHKSKQYERRKHQKAVHYLPLSGILGGGASFVNVRLAKDSVGEKMCDGVSMVKDGELIAVYNNVHRVLKAEKELKAEGLPILLIPAPRAIASDCGLAIRYDAQNRGAVENAFLDGDLWPAEIYIKRDDRYEKIEITV